MVDVLKYVSIDETTPSGTITLEQAMRELIGNEYIAPERLTSLLQTLRAMPEGNEKLVFATGLLQYCGHTIAKIARFGIIEELGAGQNRGRTRSGHKEYVLTQEEQQILRDQYESVYSLASDELNSLTFPGKPLQ